MRTRTALLALVLIGGLCVGCAPRGATPPIIEGNPTPPIPSAAAAVMAQGTQCPSLSTDSAITQLAADGAPTVSGKPLPADFDAVAVVRCKDQDETIPGDGEWDVALAQRATTGLSALTAALRTPSSKPPTGSDFACSAVGVLLPNLALVNAQGQVMRPSLPHDECGEPLTEALNAVNAMPWKTETEQRLTQVQTQAEGDTGCPPSYKDVFDLPSPKATPWTELTKPTTACEYAVPSASGGVRIGQVDVGVFVRGVTLGGPQRLAISEGLAGAGPTPAKACSTQASMFALLMVSPSENLVVELDGCLRMSYPDYFVAQAPSPVLAALRGAGF